MSRARVATKVTLLSVLFLWGGLALIAQSLLLRESLVLFFGSELSWGVVLAAWLLGVATGAWIGGLLTPRTIHPVAWLAAAVVLFEVLVPVAIWLLRGSRGWVGIGAGEYVPLAWAALLSLALISPCSLLIGVAFPLACQLFYGQPGGARTDQTRAGDGSGAQGIGWVYLVESAGSLLGGVAFTFWLVGRVDPFSTFVGTGAVLLILLALLSLYTSGRRKGAIGVVSAVLALGAAAAVSLGVTGTLDHQATLRRWETFATGWGLIESRDSRYQNITVGARQEQYSVFTNGQKQLDFPTYYGEYRLATHLAMCQHPAPENVLMLGGGASGVLAEVLLHPVLRIDYVELDPVWLEMVRDRLPDRDRRALADPRVHVHNVDARHFVKLADRKYEIVLGDLPAPTSAMHARFYTTEFYEELRRVLAPRGVFVFTTEASPAELRSEAARCLGSIYATLQKAFKDVLVEWGLTPQIYASPPAGTLTTDPDVLVRRLLERNVHLPDLEAGIDDPSILAAIYRVFFTSTDRLVPGHVARRRAELQGVARPAVSTDLEPSIYLLWLIRWDRELRGQSAELFERISRLDPWLAFAFAVVVTGTWVGWRCLRSGLAVGISQAAVVFSIATTGLATMALEIVLIFAFQNLYGYVYERVALIIGVFMFGLVVGSGAMSRLLSRWATITTCGALPDMPITGGSAQAGTAMVWRRARSTLWLVAIDGLLALLALATPLVLGVLSSLRGPAAAIKWVEPVVMSLVLLSGVLGGLAFPLAGQLYLRSGPPLGRAAGAIDAADHAGACVGALVTGIALVPVMGLATTCHLIASVKIVSTILLVAAFLALRREHN